MGYTHYWSKKESITEKKWDKFLVDFNKVLPQFIDLLQKFKDPKSEWDDSLVVTSQMVCLNGIGENGHETFCMDKEIMSFSFCKTARKPYDLAVMCALIIAKKRFGSKFSFSSDGCDEREMWLPAMKLCQNTLGYGMTLAFNKKGDAIFQRAIVI